MNTLIEALKGYLKGDVRTDAKTLKSFSRDTSLFERTPALVVYPKDAEDLSFLVKKIADLKVSGEDISLTARSAGTDMSGGPLTSSVLAVFTKYMTKVSVNNGIATTEPGVFYRDFEKATLADAHILPSYPASRAIAALGGIVMNNSGGERSLKYGKTEKYVEEVEVVLSDGSLATFKELSRDELYEKKKLQTLEGKIYREMDALFAKHKDKILAARPSVSKNSAGYALWNARDYERDTTNLAKLICGSQGTLAMMTQAKLSLVVPDEYRSMVVLFVSDFSKLPDVVARVLKQKPESFESYDHHTFGLAIKLLPQLLLQMGLSRAITLGFSFIPEVFMALRGGIPKLVLMAEFSADSQEKALAQAHAAYEELKDMNLPMRIAKNSKEAEKFWIVRREAFALLRKQLPGLTAAPFIDDFVVPPSSYPEFLPRLFAILDSYKFIYAVTGHIGDGNFHIFPLLDLKHSDTLHIVDELSHKVYDLVLEYKGTTTGEHNDGIIRTPYLEKLFGKEVVALFVQTKNIFDPLNIFNPGKKVGGTFADIEESLRKN